MVYRLLRRLWPSVSSVVGPLFLRPSCSDLYIIVVSLPWFNLYVNPWLNVHLTVAKVKPVPDIYLTTTYSRIPKVYGQTSRDMRRLGKSKLIVPRWHLINYARLDSVTRSPLDSIYGETISGVTILRAFGASSKFLRDMLRCVDTVGISLLNLFGSGLIEWCLVER